MLSIPDLPCVDFYLNDRRVFDWSCGQFKETTEKNTFLLLPCTSYDKRNGANFRITSAKHLLINWSLPVKLLKTVAYVGVEELSDGNYRWERWNIQNLLFNIKSGS